MSAYAGPVCGRCRKGMLGDQGIKLSDEREERLRKKYSSFPVCNTCKTEIMLDAIQRGAALPWDIPGHEHTNANYDKSK